MKPNIVHTIAYYPPHLGGMELRTKTIAEDFAQRGYKVFVFASNQGHKTEVAKPQKNLTILYLNSFEFAHTAFMPSLFFKLIFMPKNSVVHLHIAQAFVPEITYVVCKLRKIPYLAHIHLDVEASGPWGFLLPIYKKFIGNPIIRGADVVTVLTKDYVNLMNKKYNVKKSQLELIPNGTDFTAGKKIKQKIGKKAKILFVGRLSYQKNVPLLLNAIAILVHEHKINLQLNLAGDGEKKNELKKLVKDLKISKNVTFLGTLKPEKLQNYYRKSDITVMSSLSEGLSSVLIESMASGTPLVVTDIPSTGNIIKNGFNGLLVKHSSREMAKAIKKLIDNPKLYKKIIKNGLNEAEKYNWEKVCDKYEKVYLKLSRRTNK